MVAKFFVLLRKDQNTTPNVHPTGAHPRVSLGHQSTTPETPTRPPQTVSHNKTDDNLRVSLCPQSSVQETPTRTPQTKHSVSSDPRSPSRAQQVNVNWRISSIPRTSRAAFDVSTHAGSSPESQGSQVSPRPPGSLATSRASPHINDEAYGVDPVDKVAVVIVNTAKDGRSRRGNVTDNSLLHSDELADLSIPPRESACLERTKSLPTSTSQGIRGLPSIQEAGAVLCSLGLFGRSKSTPSSSTPSMGRPRMGTSEDTI